MSLKPGSWLERFGLPTPCWGEVTAPSGGFQICQKTVDEFNGKFNERLAAGSMLNLQMLFHSVIVRRVMINLHFYPHL